jgi:peptidoglycan/xylan/chitin deacetylase (PgdA/CDA1 family)
MDRTGILVISLDVELNWGVRDALPLARYERNLRGEREATARLLEIFAEYGIHATWAIVGFLFFEERSTLLKHLPSIYPAYENRKLCPYYGLHQVGIDEQADPLHFGASLVKMIAATGDQEIATHTFSHYYCMERGQDIEAFKADLIAAMAAARRYGLNIDSIVFPRNQVNPEYLTACGEAGLRTYRGTEQHLLYLPRSSEAERPLRRLGRLVDAYVNLTGHHISSLPADHQEMPLNVPQSRFLRPYSRKLALLEPLRLHRITSGLKAASRRQQIYHLWWHPHNFGICLEENLSFLRRILDRFHRLRDQFGMESLSMREVGQRYELTRGADW